MCKSYSSPSRCVPPAELPPRSASTYTFSPANGLIHKHTINSIHPAPHQAAYDAIRSSLERILGLAGAGASGEVTRAEGGDTR